MRSGLSNTLFERKGFSDFVQQVSKEVAGNKPQSDKRIEGLITTQVQAIALAMKGIPNPTREKILPVLNSVNIDLFKARLGPRGQEIFDALVARCLGPDHPRRSR